MTICAIVRAPAILSTGTRMTASIAGNQGARSDLFGHPRALSFLFATEM
jgi:hypothetical protein